MRVNSTGISREDLPWALRQRSVVKEARRRDACLLCRGSGVNEAGVCRVCYAMLRDEEIRIAEKWMAGLEP